MRKLNPENQQLAALISSNIRAARESTGIARYKLHTISGITHTCLTIYENSEGMALSLPTAQNLWKLARIFGIPFESFYFETNRLKTLLPGTINEHNIVMPVSLIHTVSRNLKTGRESAGLKLPEFAEMIGHRYGTVANYEDPHWRNLPELCDFPKIAAIFGVGISDLFLPEQQFAEMLNPYPEPELNKDQEYYE